MFGFKGMTNLLRIYGLQYIFMYNFNSIWESGLFHKLFKGLVNSFRSERFWDLKYLMSQDWGSMMVVAESIPGSTCEQIGAKIGILVRRISGFSLPVMENPEPDLSFDTTSSGLFATNLGRLDPTIGSSGSGFSLPNCRPCGKILKQS